MGNKIKVGLDFYPMDVNFFSDIKVRKLIKYQSGKAITIYTHLLCKIYKEGFYIKWDKELPFIISEATGFDEGYINEVIACCFKVQLLSEKMRSEMGILTSAGIQKRYLDICQRLKRKSEIPKKFEIPSEEIVIDSEGKPIGSEEFHENLEEMPTKEGKGKGKEGKEITPSRNFFRIQGKLYDKGPGDYFKEVKGPTLEAWQMNHPKEKILVQVLDRMNKDYVGQDFNNEGHLYNTFKSVWEKVKKEAPQQTATKTTINFGSK